VIRRAHSTGPAAARNAGWRATRAPLIAFTDDDCEADPGWLSRLVQMAQANPGAVVQGQTLPNPNDQSASGPFSHTLSNQRLGPWFETANVLYPKALLEALGGFDERAFSGPGGEDTDLAWRAMDAGARAVWEPEAIVYHAVSEVGWRGLLRRAWHWDETMLCFKRHPGLRRELHARMFWTGAHLRLVVALVAASPWLPRPLRALLLIPYARRLYAGRQTPRLAPFRLALDVVEMIACARGALRYRVLVL
jgi:GT2 family glycosyltransferase